jgi:hypothetical protein
MKKQCTNTRCEAALLCLTKMSVCVSRCQKCGSVTGAWAWGRHGLVMVDLDIFPSTVLDAICRCAYPGANITLRGFSRATNRCTFFNTVSVSSVDHGLCKQCLEGRSNANSV